MKKNKKEISGKNKIVGDVKKVSTKKDVVISVDPPKKRGRKPKNELINKSVEEPKNKKRGRPRKISEKSDILVENIISVDPPKKRGRKPKNIIVVAEQETKKLVDPVAVVEQKKKRGRPRKINDQENQTTISDGKKIKKLAGRKKSKNEKDSVDLDKKIVNTLKNQNINSLVFDDDLDFKEGSKRKRKRRSKTEIPVYPDFTFSDSIDIIGGDSRTDFNNAVDEEFKNGKFVWCPKNDFRMLAKMCGRYVTPKCKKRIKCELFDYGMGVRSRYGLKAYVDSEPKKKVVVEENVEVIDDAQNGD